MSFIEGMTKIWNIHTEGCMYYMQITEKNIQYDHTILLLFK